MQNNIIDIMTFKGLPSGLVGSVLSCIDDFCLSVCVPPLEDLSKAPPLRWSACLAYVGKVAISKYIYELFLCSPSGNIKDLKRPQESVMILNEDTPEGVRSGVRDLIPFYIWLCGLYNKIVIPEDFSSFCGYPIGIEGYFLGADQEQPKNSIQLVAEQNADEYSINTNNTIQHSTIRPKGTDQPNFIDAFGCSGGGSVRGGGQAYWKIEILNNLKARQTSAVGSVLLDTRYPSIVWDAQKLEKQADNIEKLAPVALRLADLPRLG